MKHPQKKSRRRCGPTRKKEHSTKKNKESAGVWHFTLFITRNKHELRGEKEKPKGNGERGWDEKQGRDNPSKGNLLDKYKIILDG